MIKQASNSEITVAQNGIIWIKAEKVEYQLFARKAIEYIIEKYTNPEKGVRNLKRNIETIYSKINLFRLLNTSDNLELFNNKIISVTFPLIITKQMIDTLLVQTNSQSTSFLHMYL
jgi:ATP-dependent Lon protease